MTFFIGLNLIF